MKKLACLLICVIASPLLAQLTPTNPPASVTLSWNSSADTNVVSSRIYYGAAPRFYTNVVSVTGTSVTIGSLARGVTYYFAATCITADGLESDFSNEISYRSASLPVPPVLQLGNSPLVKILQVKGGPYTAYQIQRAVQR